MPLRQAAAAGLTERDSDGVRVLSVSGGLDLAMASVLCRRVDAARDAGYRRLLIDLTRLEFCDSRGLRALIGAVDEVIASAGRVVVVPPGGGPVVRMFALAGASEFLPLRTTAVEGLAALGPRRRG